MSKSKSWCFTINNHTDPSIPKQWSEICEYLVYQEEQGSNGTKHLQGYIVFGTRKTLAFMKKNVHATAHWETAKGSAVQNKAYCTKDDTRLAGPWEIGSMPKNIGQGKRTDLKRLRETILTGASRRKLFKDHTSESFKYVGGISMLISLTKPPPRESMTVELHIGPPDTGKTRYCMDNFPDHWATPLRQGKTMWFDGYDLHDTVLIDDYNGEMPLVNLLRLLDRYVVQVPIKHGHAWWKPKLVIITSNYELDTWYDFSNRQASLAALQRRITKTVRYASPAPSPIIPALHPMFTSALTTAQREQSLIN